ncbi:MAG: hypothetical protein Kow0010_18030 [Dehalococcoidia bacterium]
MWRQWLSRQDPWLPAFVLGILTLSASLVVLFAVILDARDESSRASPLPSPTLPAGDTPEPTPASTPTPAPLTYFGELPPGLDPANFRPGTGANADIVFVEGKTAIRVPARYFVPVASVDTGVDSLTSAQLRALVTGDITDWASVGGIPAPVRFLAAGPPDDLALVAGYTGGAEPAETFESYADLRGAMGLGAGAIAFLPLEEVRPNVMALAIDGIDIVRGRGPVDAWPFVHYRTVVATSDAGAAALAALAEELAVGPPAAINVIATGDIIPARCSLSGIRQAGDWAAAFRGPMAELLASAHLTLGSLDASINDISTPLDCGRHTNLSAPPEVIEMFLVAGIDSLTVATNHIFDCGDLGYCGDRAFLRTIELLHEAGIRTVGGANLEEALAPAIFDVNGVTFGVLGFDDVAAMDLEATETTAGTAPLDDSYAEERDAGEPAFFRPASELSLERFTGAIRALKEQVDVVIVQVQSGTEDTHDPSERSIKALRAAVDAGATLVVGNQAHHVQALELGEAWFIAYALGNFVYDQTHSPEHEQGYVLEATFWGDRLVNLRFIPYQIEDLYRPVIANGELRTKILGDVFDASLRLLERAAAGP